MPRKPYRVLINGANFLLDFDGKREKHGFYTTRWVLANDDASAEAAAVLEMRNDSKLKGLILNDKDDPPLLHVKDINEDESLKPPIGFAFYQEEHEPV